MLRPTLVRDRFQIPRKKKIPDSGSELECEATFGSEKHVNIKTEFFSSRLDCVRGSQ